VLGRHLHAFTIVLLLLSGCGHSAPPQEDDALHLSAGRGGVRRLTRFEYDNTVADLLGDTTRSGQAALPEDPKTPFDNDFRDQNVSSVLIGAAESLARAAAERAVANATVRDRIVSCRPKAPDDAECLRAFITAFGERALRRPLAPHEVERFLGLQSFAKESGDFYTGVALVIEALLQEPEFLYRVELGDRSPEAPAIRRLNDFDIATRLSYFLIGSTPPDELLKLAEASQLHTRAQRHDAALKLLADPRAGAIVDRFHALWLGYTSLPHPPDLSAAMQAESAALVKRVVIERNADYLDVFRSPETYVSSDALADTYGLPRVGATPQWVTYSGPARKGILSHGSVLSAALKFGDTSVTQRGLFVRRRLMCQDIPPPPPNVDVNKPLTTGGKCKKQKQMAHAVGGCASCHDRMDKIGYGMENFDTSGRYRTFEDGAPDCPIDGQGEIVGMGTFQGVAGLADLLLSDGTLESCVAQEVYRFALGRMIDSGLDAYSLEQIEDAFTKGEHRFSELLIGIVESDGFVLRKEEE
jgi:hypothetical protein